MKNKFSELIIYVMIVTVGFIDSKIFKSIKSENMSRKNQNVQPKV